MDFFNELTTCSDEAFNNAIIVALATHKDKRIKNLASGYNDAEIGDIAIRTPAALLLIATMTIDVALRVLAKNRDDDPGIDALAKELKQLLADKQKLDTFLTIF